VTREVISLYTIDRQRIVAHGMGSGGSLAFYLAFHFRDLVHGVATIGSALAVQPVEGNPQQRLSFFIVAGGKDPLLPSILETKSKLADKKFPLIFRQIPDRGAEYVGADDPAFRELARWIESLDRL
jgi:poly(3-hydroxybutyrate) depolymerase